MKQRNTISQYELDASIELLKASAKDCCRYTRAELKKEFMKIDAIDFSTYEGNLSAISILLQYFCQTNTHKTYLDQEQNLASKSGEIIVTKLPDSQLLVELLQPGQERSRAQRELEYNTNEAGDVYLVVRNFVEFGLKFRNALRNGKIKLF